MKNETLKKWAFKKVNESYKKCVKNAKEQSCTKECYPTKEKLLDAWFIKERFTKKELKELCSKSYEQIINANTKKVIEKCKKTLEQTKSKIEKICLANIPNFISVSVEWFNSRTWGANPQAEVRTGENYHISRKVGGCGYDKESIATAECFNKDLGILKIALFSLYKKEHSKKYLGSGYGTTINLFGVSFSSGVGFNCHRSIIENSGLYKLTAQNSGKMFNTYNFEKIKRG
jgi:hypothetical protein